MTSYLFKAKNELKRVDHLLYVSLKYTRTVDVLRSIIDRLINAYDFMILALLEKMKDKGKVDEIPLVPWSKCDALQKLYKKDENIINNIDFYLYLRKLIRAKYTRSNEFRRHVTMTSFLTEGDKEEVIEITMDIIKEYYEKAGMFIEYLNEVLKH